jgi:hypothetical protein
MLIELYNDVGPMGVVELVFPEYKILKSYPNSEE